MRRNRMLSSLALIVIVVAALVLAVPAARQVAQAQDSPAEPAMGTVLQGQLLVRGAPDVAGAVIGRVTHDQRVTILREQDGWLEIVYPLESDGSGWVSAHYVQIDGRTVPNLPAAPVTASPAAVAAPSLVGFSQPATFRWRWSGTVPAGIEWRFDILIFQRNAASQYKTIRSTRQRWRRKAMFTQRLPTASPCSAARIGRCAYRNMWMAAFACFSRRAAIARISALRVRHRFRPSRGHARPSLCRLAARAPAAPAMTAACPAPGHRQPPTLRPAPATLPARPRTLPLSRPAHKAGRGKGAHSFVLG